MGLTLSLKESRLQQECLLAPGKLLLFTHGSTGNGGEFKCCARDSHVLNTDETTAVK